MTPLASVADVEDRLGRGISDPDERLRLTRLLSDASGSVRTYTGRTWLVGTGTLTVRSPRSGYVTLDGVTSITSVVDASTGAAVPFEFDGGDRVYLWPAAYRYAFDYEFRGVPTLATITYEAADPPPDEVVGVVCQMATRAFGIDPTSSGHQQESIAGYSYSVGTAAASGAVGMLQGERDVLDRWRRVGATAWLGSM